VRISIGARIKASCVAAVFILTAGSSSTFQAADHSRHKASTQSGKQSPKVRVERNVVRVRVVVRDASGRAVPGLTKDDFRLFDNGAQQVIGNFVVETARGPATLTPATKASKLPGARPRVRTTPASRFVALFFDDFYLTNQEATWMRLAGAHFLDTPLKPGVRVGIFTSSGEDEVGFSSDRAKLRAAVLGLQPRGFIAKSLDSCPPLDDYEAYLISESEQKTALAIATAEVVDCRCGGVALTCPNAQRVAKMAARGVWEAQKDQLRFSLQGLNRLVRQLSVMPGRRNILLVSPGFISTTQWPQINDIVDRAVRAGVVINALDPRGAWTVTPGKNATAAGLHLSPQLQGQNAMVTPSGSATATGLPMSTQLEGQKVMMTTASVYADRGVLEELAHGTGGIFFHDNNDFKRGFREGAGQPEVSYLLAFSPRDLRRNGKYHKLRVTLANGVRKRGWTLQARKGYFAPGAATSAEEVRRAIQDAVFSQSSMAGLPIQVETRLVQSSAIESKLTVITHLDAHALHFVVEGGRNVDTVKFVSVVFDDSGDYVDGTVRTVQFHLLEPSLKQILAQGLAVPMTFTLAPGNYLVRVVVRDANGTLAVGNRMVHVTF
jgi:VWFA-related protein